MFRFGSILKYSLASSIGLSLFSFSDAPVENKKIKKVIPDEFLREIPKTVYLFLNLFFFKLFKKKTDIRIYMYI